MNVLARVMRAAWDDASKPITDVKGDQFERFVRDKLFPKETHDIIAKTPANPENKPRHAPAKPPNLRFKTKANGFEFYVEAKFRAKSSGDGKLEWCKNVDLKRHQETDNTTPVLLALGLGGRPSAPAKVYLIPVRHIRFTKLHTSFLQRYEIPPNRSISPGYVKSIL